MDKPLLLRERQCGGVTCKSGVLGVAFALSSLPVLAAPLYSSLADMSIEDLATIRITSVSKKAEPLADAAASVYVITAQDIRRSGVTNLPEALRLAPNLQVAQTSGSGYAISARGFNGNNNSAPNKLLVLIDGRSVYTPLFSGVFWDVQDVMLEDVERIEVISGPGGTLWGRMPSMGSSTSLPVRPGTRRAEWLRSMVETANRYGISLWRNAGGRRQLSRLRQTRGSRTHRERGWQRGQRRLAQERGRISGRLGSAGRSVHGPGECYRGRESQPAPGAIAISGVNLALGTVAISGVNLTTHWMHLLEGGSNVSVQAYYDRSERTVPPIFDETLDIVDLQFQHSLRPSGMHAVVWGANFRYGMDRVANTSPVFAFLPANADQRWASLFAQDEMTLRHDLRLIVGARVEHNDYTGNELLPNARLAWKFAPDHLLWTAASRTVRAPSRLDRDAYIPGSPPFLLDGGRETRSEVANVFEVGYRGQPATAISYSVTVFHTIYDHLRTQEIDPSVTFISFANEMEGTATGIETWGTYQASPRWRLSAGATALRERLRLKQGSNDFAAPNAAGNDPSYTWQLRSALNIAEDRELDFTIRHAASLENNAVPAYTAVDARFGWKLRRDLELSVTGQNLFGHHAEYGSRLYRTDLSPAVYLKLLWKI